jgi:hypothetical protein
MFWGKNRTNTGLKQNDPKKENPYENKKKKEKKKKKIKKIKKN